MLFAFFLSAIVLGSPLSNETEFFDYACTVKAMELDMVEMEACQRYVNDQNEPLTPYLETLRDVFSKQLKLRMGGVNVSQEFLDKKVHRQMKIFLKDKLGMQKRVVPAYDLAGRAKWDPHFHGSSLFSDLFPKARLYLPNYIESYAHLKEENNKLGQGRDIFIKRAMEDKSFAEITESCSGYDKWHYAHAGKRIIPILAHKREDGAVLRHDVLGYDMCGLEEEDRYQPQRGFLESMEGSKVVRMHMGETIVPSEGRDHVHMLLEEAEQYYTSDKPLRIGHGTHISIEDMLRVAEKGYYIEACLTSNKRTGILDKRSDYPLGVMLLLGVKVVIGTDGGRLYSTTLPEEYAYAVKSLKKFHRKVKESDESVVLPNGDSLCFKHILSLMREEKKGMGMALGEECVTYRELDAYLDPSVIERISGETLVENAAVLLKECYNR